MNALRFLRPECIQIPLTLVRPEEIDEETPEQMDRRKKREKEMVMEELAAIFGRCDAVINQRKLHKDLIQREANASTAIAPAIAIPHVRSLQARELVMGVAITDDAGLHYGSIDGQPTKLFILLAAPPYDDRLFLQLHRAWATILRDEENVDRLRSCSEVQEVFNCLRPWFH